MADGTHIEWTDATWNPITGCAIVSKGCTNCYAMKLAGTRLRHHPSRAGLTRETKAGPVWTGEVRFNEQWLDQPIRWRRPRRIFVCAHGDLFAEGVPDEWIDRVFAVMVLASQHTYQVLTKRPERMRAYVSEPATVRRIYELVCDLVVDRQMPVILIAPGIDERAAPPGPRVHLDTWPLPNVWLGVSTEDQATADERIPELLATPAAVRFVSAEPLLGAMDLGDYLHRVTGRAVDPICDICDERHEGPCEANALDWVIVGGESGPDARPMHPNWARSIRDQCQEAGVAFFFKQWGAWAPGGNATWPATKTERTASWCEDRWHFDSLTPRQSEETHRDDEPDVFLLGKAAAGRLLDGREWSEFPEGRS